MAYQGLKSLLLASLLVLPLGTMAQRLYKCTDAAGNTVYQQESCAPTEAEEERTFVREEPTVPLYDDAAESGDGLDSRRLTGIADRASGSGASAPVRSTTPGVYRDRFGTTIDSRSAASEELRRAQNRSGSTSPRF